MPPWLDDILAASTVRKQTRPRAACLVLIIETQQLSLLGLRQFVNPLQHCDKATAVRTLTPTQLMCTAGLDADANPLVHFFSFKPQSLHISNLIYQENPTIHPSADSFPRPRSSTDTCEVFSPGSLTKPLLRVRPSRTGWATRGLNTHWASPKSEEGGQAC